MNVVFRADASVQLGGGHIMRCLTLAKAMKTRGANVHFICRRNIGDLNDYIEQQGFVVYRLPALDEVADIAPAQWQRDSVETADVIADIADRVEWLIVDHYTYDADWERAIRRCASSIMVIDDLADRPHFCDVLLDQNLCVDYRLRYDRLAPGAVLLLGPDYALLRPEFWQIRARVSFRHGGVRRLQVFFGTTDPTAETEKALQAIWRLDHQNILVDVIVGARNQKQDYLRDLCAHRRGVEFHCQVNDMGALMAVADLAIGAAGSATWERCCLYLPTLLVVTAENQRAIAEGVAAAGAAMSLGWHAEVDVGTIANHLALLIDRPDRVSQMSRRAGDIVDGAGVERVLRALGILQ